ncbi:MAG TPA: 50S ribosomal protein L31e [Candidatus Acidoferrales bacterium]|nr:50S ribosomal protein L31e [Candidatus Acidoferrales bacterium]
MPKETKQTQVQEQITEETELAPAPQETAEPQTTEVTPTEAPTTQEAAVEETKAARKKKEEEVVEERFYTIPLSKALIRPPKKRAPRAMQLIKIFITKHMKLSLKVSEEEEEEELPQLVISPEVNEKVWGRGIEKPPRKIKTRVTKDRDGNVTVFLAEN